MKNKQSIITLLTDIAAGYVLTLGLWNQPNHKI